MALAEIGQEETGKSLTLLAGFQFGSTTEAWNWFWRGWNNHQMKAHRAYLYQIIDPLRLELTSSDGRQFVGGPLRSKICLEKEHGLYVDFDNVSSSFFLPSEQISNFEAIARITTLFSLALTADALRRTLLADNHRFRLHAFAELALRICSESIYQQDWPTLIFEFRNRTAQHEALVAELDAALAANQCFCDESFGSPPFSHDLLES
ncbi:MAG: AbiV family abortive infection protein [Acidobacteriaceae bacterium]